MKAKQLAIDIAGWYGAAAIVGAYFLNSFGFVHANSLAYQALNLTGAVGIIIEASSKKDWPSMALNIVWILIALVALVRII